MKRSTLILAILALILGSAFANSPLPEIKVEVSALGGSSALSIRSDVRGAEVWVDYIRRGTVPLDITGLAPGSHLVILRRDGYYDNVFHLTLAPDTTTTVFVSLRLKTGYVQIQTEPGNAQVIHDGSEYKPGMLELPVGNRFLTIKAFGYQEKTLRVFIVENVVVKTEAILERAPFEATAYATSRLRFNPRNAGARGLVRASFLVTAPGRAITSIFAPDGSLVDEFRSEIFSDWNQFVEWDGNGQDLNPVTDGRYLVRVHVTPEEGLSYVQDHYTFESYVTVDSSVVVTPRGQYGALPGSLWAPEAFSSADSSLGLAFAGLVRGSFGEVPGGGAFVAVAGSLEGLLDAGVALMAGTEDESGAALLGLKISTPLSGPFGLAFHADGRLAAASLASPAWARGGLTLGFGSRFANLVLAPDLGAYWQDGFSVRAGLGTALTLSSYSTSISLSGRLESASLDTGFIAAWPLQTGLELRFLPPELPLGLRVFGSLAWDPEPVSWYAGLGLSVGL